MDLRHTGLEGALLGQRAVDPGLDRHFPHRGLVRACLGAGWRHAVAVLHDARLRLCRRERQPLHILDVVHALVTRHHQAQRPAMRQRQGLAVHFPGQDGIVQRLQGHRALDKNGQRVHTFGQLFTTGSGDIRHAVHQPTQGGHHVAQRHTAPHHTTGGTHRPRRTAGLAGEEPPTIARALQHRGDGVDAQRLELGQAQRARAFDALDGHGPGIAVLQNGGVGCGQIVANIQLVRRRDHAGAEGCAAGFQGAAAVHDQRIGALPAGVARQRLGRGCGLGTCNASPASQPQRTQCGSASGQHVAAWQCHRVLHGQGPPGIKETGEVRLATPDRPTPQKGLGGFCVGSRFWRSAFGAQI